MRNRSDRKQPRPKHTELRASCQPSEVGPRGQVGAVGEKPHAVTGRRILAPGAPACSWGRSLPSCRRAECRWAAACRAPGCEHEPAAHLRRSHPRRRVCAVLALLGQQPRDDRLLRLEAPLLHQLPQLGRQPVLVFCRAHHTPRDDSQRGPRFVDRLGEQQSRRSEGRGAHPQDRASPVPRRRRRC